MSTTDYDTHLWFAVEHVSGKLDQPNRQGLPSKHPSANQTSCISGQRGNVCLLASDAKAQDAALQTLLADDEPLGVGTIPADLIPDPDVQITERQAKPPLLSFVERARKECRRSRLRSISA